MICSYFHILVAHGIGDTALIHFKISMRLFIIRHTHLMVFFSLRQLTEVTNHRSNCWQSLFKLSFHNILKEVLFICCLLCNAWSSWTTRRITIFSKLEMTVQLSTHKMYKTILIQLGVLWCGRRKIFKSLAGFSYPV
jgi:hypothetical protein